MGCLSAFFACLDRSRHPCSRHLLMIHHHFGIQRRFDRAGKKGILNGYFLCLTMGYAVEAGTSAYHPKTFSKKVCMHHFLQRLVLQHLVCLFWPWACICKPNRSKRYMTEGKSQLRRKVMKRLRRL